LSDVVVIDMVTKLLVIPIYLQSILELIKI
jgi:hypothetical protein